jgi:uncharacterized protein YbjT (DUF2867 family)
MNNKTILVFGATGRMGGAAVRHLHQNGWHVRAVSRNPDSTAAQLLQSKGIEVVQANMDDPASLRGVFNGVYGVFLVVNWIVSGFDGEVRQGKHVADAAAEAGVQHLVFAAAGTGERGTGIGHFESKLDIEAYINQKQIPLTMILPPPFMELMTDPTLYPQAGMWNAKIKILGKNHNLPWIAADDIGGMAPVIFSQPEQYIGRRIKPVGDWKTPGECHQIYQEITGKQPPRWPLPLWVMRKMQPELIKMWEWLRDTDSLSRLELEPAMSLYPDSKDVRAFLHHEFSANS